MLKYRPNGEKLVFDEEGNARAAYELEDETKFREKGLAEEQREKFVLQEREKVARHDLEDKAVVKEKRLEKKIRRKQREKEAAKAAVAQTGGYESDDDNAPKRDLLQDKTRQDEDADEGALGFEDLENHGCWFDGLSALKCAREWNSHLTT